jgi:Ca2+-binding RTX toxin-like protein
VVRRGDVAFDCERVRVLAGTVHRPRGEVIRGTRESDSLTGTERRDFIFGLAGDDLLAGLGGSDFLFGGRDDDRLEGGDQRDYAWGGGGDDEVAGGAGPDWLFGGLGSDQLSGDGGNDRLFAAADDGAADALDCGENDGDWDRAVLRPADAAVNCERVFTLAS